MAKQDIYVVANDYGIEGAEKFDVSQIWPQTKGNPPIISAWKKTPRTRNSMLQRFFDPADNGRNRWFRHIQSADNFKRFNEHMHISYDESLLPAANSYDAYNTLKRSLFSRYYGDDGMFPKFEDFPDFRWDRFVEPSPSVMRALILESQINTAARRSMDEVHYRSAFTKRQNQIRLAAQRVSITENKLVHAMAKANEVSVSKLIETHLVKDNKFVSDTDFLSIMVAAKYTPLAQTQDAAIRVFEQSVNYSALLEAYEIQREETPKFGRQDIRGRMYNVFAYNFFNYAANLSTDVWHSVDEETRNHLGVMFYNYLYNNIEKATNSNTKMRENTPVAAHVRKDILKAYLQKVHHRHTDAEENEMLSIVEAVPSEVFKEFIKL